MGKAFLVVAASVVILATPALAAKQGAGAGGIQSAAACGTCHVDIYRNWSGSLHALAYQNPIFQAAYLRAFTETKGQAAQYCLGCHAPTVAATGDYGAKLGLTAEGVTCDFCHSVVKVTLGQGSVFTLEPGDVKRAALEKPRVPKEHGVAYSGDFASSRLCAGCHDFINRNGVHVGRTFDEWRASSFAKAGTHCQSCHMPAVPGLTADKGGREGIHDHSLSHNTAQMRDSVAVEVGKVSRDAGTLVAEVSVHNWRAGHAIPTGTPARTLVLEVRALDKAGRVMETKKIVYGKTVVDAQGRELATDGDAFLYGMKIAKDNRLAPDEKRNESIRFTAGAADAARVEASMYFFNQPFVIQRTEMTIPLATASAPVR